MAKRRREPEEKPVDWGFESEPFDEDAMVLKEARGFRSSLIVIAWAFVAAIVSFFVWSPLKEKQFAWELTLLVGLAVGGLLKWVLPLAKVPVGDMHKKEWFGTGMTYFFSWLAFLLLFANPPIYDGAEPNFDVTITPAVQEVGGQLFVYVVVGDNEGLDLDTLELTIIEPGNRESDVEFELDDRAGHYVWHATTSRPGTYELHGDVVDVNGNAASVDKHFDVVAAGDVVTVRLPDDATFDDLDDKLIVRLAPCEGDACLDVWRVAAVFPGGANVTLKYDREDKAFFTSPKVEGNASWGGEGTTSFRVYVWEHAAHQRDLPLDEAAVVKGPYNVTITEDFPVEDGKEPSARKRPLRAQTPGFDLVGGAAAIALALVVMSRRKKA